MRKFELLFLAIAFMTTKSNGQTLQPSDLADKIVYAFQTKDFEIYKKLLIDSGDYKEFMNDFFKNNHIPQSEQQRFVEKEKIFADSADLKYRKEFERLLKKGEKLSIDWTKIKKDTFVFKVDEPVNSNKKALTGYLNFTYKNTVYVFFGIEAMELSSGYKISNIRTILKGGVEQYVNPDLLDNGDL
jgi:hypothetical protein